MNALVHLYRENGAAALISAAIGLRVESQREKAVARLSAGPEAEKSPNLMDKV
jgi:hypothetical protein